MRSDITDATIFFVETSHLADSDNSIKTGSYIVVTDHNPLECPLFDSKRWQKNFFF